MREREVERMIRTRVTNFKIKQHRNTIAIDIIASSLTKETEDISTVGTSRACIINKLLTDCNT